MFKIDLDELKQFLKVDGNDLDVVLTGYQSAAEIYLLNAGVKQTYDNGLYKTVVSIFCGILLENPTLLNVNSRVDSIGVTYNSLITQLSKS